MSIRESIKGAKHTFTVKSSMRKKIQKSCLICGHNMHYNPEEVLSRIVVRKAFWRCPQCGYES